MSEEREIKTISFGRACREKRGMYSSADDLEALHLALREVYVNSLDALTETNQRQGTIQITIDSKTHLISVVDDGPGIPNKVRDDGIDAVVAAYTLPHTGSHFDGRQVNSIGTNGVGGSLVNHTAETFQIISCDGKTAVEAHFVSDDEGAQIRQLTKKETTAHGVSIVYKPDPLIYHNAWFNKEVLQNELSEMMKFYPKYTIKLIIDGKTVEYHYPEGLKEKDTKIYYESDEVIIALNTKGDGIKAYGNRLHLPQGGAFFTHFKTQLTKIVNDLSGLKLNGAQVLSVFGGYVAVFVNNPLFSNQSKTAISNKECNTEITVALKNELTDFSKTDEWAKIVKELELELKAEQAAAKARAKVKAALDDIKKGSRKKIVVADALKDCVEHGESAWLAITEGLSAQGSINSGRDIKHVATFPIRGKIINCLKNTQENFLDNEELKQICQILGCGIFEDYNPKKLRYGKVLIAVDGDSDGLNIACLLTTLFYVVMPQFIKEGRLYWMRAPLYYNESQHKYIFTEEQWKKERNKSGFVRAKGYEKVWPLAIFPPHQRGQLF